MMGLRFRQSLTILPGLRLNLGRRGVSLSVGMRGLHTTFGRRAQTTVGLPGSGLSYTISHRRRRGAPRPSSPLDRLITFVIWVVLMVLFFRWFTPP